MAPFAVSRESRGTGGFTLIGPGAGAKWRGHKAVHDRGDIDAYCALKIREIPLVLLLVIWPVDEGLVEIVDAHCDGSLSVDCSGGYHGVCRALCDCSALFILIST
eukprot:scaffold2128_cov38-Cyclotella_meneghiniana.AAC.2